MANEEKTDALQADDSGKGGGNFVAIFGKIFLSLATIGAQIFLSLYLMNNYYSSIDGMMASFSASETAYHEIENLIINPSGSDGERYLLLSMALELNSSGDIMLIERDGIKIRDQINTILSYRTVEQLNDLGSRDALKREIGVAINLILDKKAVQNLFFTKYVMQ